MSLMKNYLRAELLESLMMRAIHRNRGNKLDLDIVVNKFKAQFPLCSIAL